MAGRQRRKEMIHQLERRLAKWSETQDEDKTYDVLDYCCSWVASGNTMTKLADEITEDMKWDISRDMIMRYISSDHPDAHRRLEKARQEGAHGLVDQAIQIIDDANTSDKEQLMKAKMQAEVRQWVGERWNRKDLGRAPDVQITVNHNTLHLDAMRVRQLQRAEHEKSVLERAPVSARLISADRAVSEADVIEDAIVLEHDES